MEDPKQIPGVSDDSSAAGPAPEPLADESTVVEAAADEAAESPVAIVPDSVPVAARAPDPGAASFPPFPASGQDGSSQGGDPLLDVSLPVSVELGRTRMTIGEILGLRSGSVIELDRLAGAPTEILVNGTLIALGEVVAVDEKLGVRIIEVVSRP